MPRDEANPTADRPVDRRTVVKTTGAALAGVALAGCSGDGEDGGDDGGKNEIAAGPDGKLVFEPKELTVSTGTTVTWTFESAGHNVSAWPDMHERISIPDGAEGFGTMEKGGDGMSTVSKGETFEHTFETPGEYTYVCVPHVSSDMVGTITVEE